jgi:hypothetical protein
MKTNILGTEDSLKLYDKAGKAIYEFDKHYLYPNYWNETTYDKNSRVLTILNSAGFWCKYTRDSDGNQLTYEDSNGVKRGFDLPEFTMEQLVEKLGINFKLIK